VTAYPFPAASPAPPTATTADPTAVVGRRIGGFVIDLLLYILVMAFVGPTPLSPLAEYYQGTEALSDPCEDVRELEDDVASCVEIGDRTYFTTNGDVAVQIVTWVAFVGLYAALQGATGRTPGKAVFGLKVVNEQGRNPGFGRGLVRTLLWIVDGQPCGIPLVGFITGLTTKGHRRVGDMAAKTFVVGKAHSGPVVVPGLTTAATSPYGAPGAPGAPWGAPQPAASGPPTWGGPARPQAPWGGPPSGGFPPPGAAGPPTGAPPTGPPSPAPSGAPAPSGHVARPAPPTARPAAPPSGETPAATPPDGPSSSAPPAATPSGETAAPPAATPSGETPAGQAPSGGAPSPAAPGASPGETTPPAGAATPGPQQGPWAPTPAPAPAAQPAPPSYNPQWDAARGTYIVWEPQRGQWLGWDEAAKQWRPL